MPTSVVTEGPGSKVGLYPGTREVITLVAIQVEREGKGGRREHLEK